MAKSNEQVSSLMKALSDYQENHSTDCLVFLIQIV